MRRDTGQNSAAGQLELENCPWVLLTGDLLANLTTVVPELAAFANLHLEVAFNKDSCRVGPPEWARLARLLDANRAKFDAFIIVHGTDTMAYTASALSLMLLGFHKPIVVTGDTILQLASAHPSKVCAR